MQQIWHSAHRFQDPDSISDKICYSSSTPSCLLGRGSRCEDKPALCPCCSRQGTSVQITSKGLRWNKPQSPGGMPACSTIFGGRSLTSSNSFPSMHIQQVKRMLKVYQAVCRSKQSGIKRGKPQFAPITLAMMFCINDLMHPSKVLTQAFISNHAHVHLCYFNFQPPQ